jgi:hypothetical protein
MNQEEIKAKSAELAALYTAKANGKTLQVEYSDGWKDCVDCNGPSMQSDPSRWRVKPELRRCWLSPCGIGVSGVTFDESVATRWKQQGMKVTEWLEVLP